MRSRPTVRCTRPRSRSSGAKRPYFQHAAVVRRRRAQRISAGGERRAGAGRAAGQEDALLPAVEEGLVTLIGATTENPYFEVNSALISRTHVYELEELNAGDIRVLLDRAVQRGEVGPEERVSFEALEFLAERSGGD